MPVCFGYDLLVKLVCSTLSGCSPTDVQTNFFTLFLFKMYSDQEKSIIRSTSSKDVSACHAKSVPLNIGSPQEGSQDSIRVQPSLEQVECPVESTIGRDKGPIKTSDALTKERVLAFPVSSGSHSTSSSSSQGLVFIIRIPATTTTKVTHPKKKSNNKGKPTHQTKDKHHIEKISSDLDADYLMKI